jgi:WD40 repeat protein
MSIEFACPHCGNSLKVKDGAAGKKGTCKACQGLLEVPRDATCTSSPAGKPAAIAEKTSVSQPTPTAAAAAAEPAPPRRSPFGRKSLVAGGITTAALVSVIAVIVFRAGQTPETDAGVTADNHAVRTSAQLLNHGSRAKSSAESPAAKVTANRPNERAPMGNSHPKRNSTPSPPTVPDELQLDPTKLAYSVGASWTYRVSSSDDKLDGTLFKIAVKELDKTTVTLNLQTDKEKSRGIRIPRSKATWLVPSETIGDGGKPALTVKGIGDDHPKSVSPKFKTTMNRLSYAYDANNVRTTYGYYIEVPPGPMLRLACSQWQVCAHLKKEQAPSRKLLAEWWISPKVPVAVVARARRTKGSEILLFELTDVPDAGKQHPGISNAERRKAIRWLQQHNRFGERSQIVDDFIANLHAHFHQDQDHILQWVLGAGLTKTGNAFILQWHAGRFSTRMASSTDAAGIARNQSNFSVRKANSAAKTPAGKNRNRKSVSTKVASPKTEKSITTRKPHPSVPLVKELRRIRLDSSAHTVRFSHSRRYVLSLAHGEDIRIWDTENGKEVGKLAGHRGGASTFIVLPGGKQALSCDSWTLYLWDIEKRAQRKIAVATPFGDDAKLPSFPVHTQAMSVGGDRVLMAWGPYAPAVWNLKLQKQERVLKSPATRHFALSPDGKTAILVNDQSEDCDVYIWDIERDKELRKLPKHKHAVWNTPAFSPDGRRALTYDTGFPGIIYIWEVPSGKEIRRFEGHEDSVGVAIFSPDGRRVLSGPGDRLDAPTFERTGNSLTIRRIRRKGKNKDQIIRLWDADSGKEICWLEGHTDAIRSLAFSADGQFVVSCSDDKTIRIWKMPK